jgi:hypothetical protein
LGGLRILGGFERLETFGGRVRCLPEA